MKNFTPILLVAVAIGLFYIYISPEWQSVQSLRSEQKEYSDAIVKAKELQAVRDELLTRYNAMSSEDLDRLEKIIPQNANTVRLVRDIATVAAGYGAQIEEVSVNEEAPIVDEEVGLLAAPYRSIALILDVAASYDAFVNLISDLEQSLRLLDISGISFSVDDESAVYSHKVELTTYRLNN